MKKKEMKKVLPAIVAVVLVLGAGLAMAGSNGQGVPSAKCAAGWDSVDYDPGVHNVWKDVPGLNTTVIKTSNKADLIISVTAECALATDVKIKGTGKDETSESLAQIKIRALVDGDDADAEAEPGDVVFAYRKMVLKGLLWAPEDFEPIDPEGLLELPEQYIEIYEETRTANGFNFVMKDVESGVHEITIQIMTNTSSDVENGHGDVGAVIGKRTLVVEAVRMVN